MKPELPFKIDPGTKEDVMEDPLSPTIFHEHWWLDIATRGQYTFAEVASNGKVVGRLPYYLEKHSGLSISRMPTLTRFLGPSVETGAGNVSARFLKRLSITHELISKTPAALLLQDCLPPRRHGINCFPGGWVPIFRSIHLRDSRPASGGELEKNAR